MDPSQPSETAKLIARAILLASFDRRYDKMLAPESVKHTKQILSSPGIDDSSVRWFAYRPVRWLCWRMEKLLLHGIIAHYLLRKKQIEEWLRLSFHQGSRTVMILGGGFDTLAYRLHQEFPEVQFIEADHPATLKVKEKALDAGANLAFLPIDLTCESPSSLLQGRAQMGRPVTVVLEGVTMYLSPEEVAGIFCDLSEQLQQDSTVVFTIMEKQACGNIDFRNQNGLVKKWLKRRQEPFKWGVSPLKLDAFLSDYGLNLSRLTTRQDLLDRYMPDDDQPGLALAEGEMIARAQIGTLKKGGARV